MIGVRRENKGQINYTEWTRAIHTSCRLVKLTTS